MILEKPPKISCKRWKQFWKSLWVILYHGMAMAKV